jgi:hypothetical protein
VETEDVAREDSADEDDRVFLAYCRKHKIKVSDLSDAEFRKRHAEALADRESYPIPTSDPQFLYHGTNTANLPKIALQGLRQSNQTHTQTGNVALATHSLGKVFFTTTIRNATFYAVRAGARKRVALLRVRRDALPDMQPDSQDSESFLVDRAVPADQIEVWNGRRWSSL